MVHCLLVGLPCFSTITKFQKIGSVQSLFLLGRTIHAHPTHRIDFKSVDWNANRQSGSCKASVQQTIQIEVMTTNQAGSKEQQICCSRVLKTGVTPGHSRSIFGWVTTMSFWGKSIKGSSIDCAILCSMDVVHLQGIDGHIISKLWVYIYIYYFTYTHTYSIIYIYIHILHRGCNPPSCLWLHPQFCWFLHLAIENSWIRPNPALSEIWHLHISLK